MEPQYRALAEGYGYELLHRERRMLGGSPPTALVGVLVVTSVVSHPLREYACELLSLALYRAGRQAVRRGVRPAARLAARRCRPSPLRPRCC